MYLETVLACFPTSKYHITIYIPNKGLSIYCLDIFLLFVATVHENTGDLIANKKKPDIYPNLLGSWTISVQIAK